MDQKWTHWIKNCFVLLKCSRMRVVCVKQEWKIILQAHATHFAKFSIFPKFTSSQNSHFPKVHNFPTFTFFQNSHFSTIHIFQNSHFPKFTFFQNSHFPKFTFFQNSHFFKIHVFQEFIISKNWIQAPNSQSSAFMPHNPQNSSKKSNRLHKTKKKVILRSPAGTADMGLKTRERIVFENCPPIMVCFVIFKKCIMFPTNCKYTG